VMAFSSDLNKEGTMYDGPSAEDVTKEEVIAIYDKWEEEVRVIVQVISFVRLQ
jgi:salicylate hydroxylase